jgi:hypothetical protein
MVKTAKEDVFVMFSTANAFRLSDGNIATIQGNSPTTS